MSNVARRRSCPPIETLRVRPARTGDISAMVRLLGQLFALETDFSPDPARQRRGLRRLLADRRRARLFVAEAGGQVVGMCSLLLHVSTAEGGRVGVVEDVVVDATSRGAGVGRRLMAAIDAEAERLRLSRLQLLADRSNRRALGFYRALGWADTRLICLRRSRPAGHLA